MFKVQIRRFHPWNNLDHLFFVQGSRSKVRPKSNIFVDIVYFVKTNMNIPQSKKIRQFFFDVTLNLQGWPIAGDDSKLSPLSLYMTTLKLLRFSDGRNQNNMNLLNVSLLIFTPFDLVKTPTLGVLTIGFLSQLISYSPFTDLYISIKSYFRMLFFYVHAQMKKINMNQINLRNIMF